MKNEEMNKFISLIATLLIGLVFLIIATFLIGAIKSIFEPKIENKQLERIESDTKEIRRNLTPYESKEQLKKITIVKDFENTTRNEQTTKYFNSSLTVNGLISQGYLFVKVSIDNKTIQDNGDVYVKLSGLVNYQNQDLGGHLIQSRGLETSNSPDQTELLYELSDIKYKKDFKDSNLEVISANWLDLLNEGTGKTIFGFTSTVGQGKIIELSLYYDCVKGSDCSIVAE